MYTENSAETTSQPSIATTAPGVTTPSHPRGLSFTAIRYSVPMPKIITAAEDRPAEDGEGDPPGVAQPGVGEDRRQGGDHEDHDAEEHDRPDREQQRLAPLGDEALRLLGLVGDVDPRDEGRHSTRCAPQGDQQGDHQGDRHTGRTGVADRRELEHEEVLHLLGQRRGNVLDLLGDVVRVGDQAVDGDERDECRNERQERVKGDAGSDEGEVVLANPRGKPGHDSLHGLGTRHPHRATIRQSCPVAERGVAREGRDFARPVTTLQHCRRDTGSRAMTATLTTTGVWSGELRYGDAGQAAEAAAELEGLGYGALWIPDVGGDLFGALANLLAATERVTVATGILNLWMHTAEETASQFAELTARHGNRLLLGIGVSHAPLIDKVKAEGTYRRPLQQVRAYLDSLDATDHPVPREDRVLAALGPKMLDLAARADGRHPPVPGHTRAHRCRPETLSAPTPSWQSSRGSCSRATQTRHAPSPEDMWPGICSSPTTRTTGSGSASPTTTSSTAAATASSTPSTCGVTRRRSHVVCGTTTTPVPVMLCVQVVSAEPGGLPLGRMARPCDGLDLTDSRPPSLPGTSSPRRRDRCQYSSMPGYAIAHLRTPQINDDVLEYIERIQATLDPFGGKFLVHGATVDVIEGSWPGTIVIIEFPTTDDARAWYESPDYQAILPLRTNHIDGEAIIVDGVAPGYDAADTAARLRVAR